MAGVLSSLFGSSEADKLRGYGTVRKILSSPGIPCREHIILVPSPPQVSRRMASLTLAQRQHASAPSPMDPAPA